MKTFMKAAALALAPVSVMALATPANAQSKLGIGVVSPERALATSNAFKTAQDQIKVTYKSNIDNFTARQTALNTELKQKSDALRTAAQAAGQNPTAAQRTALQTQYEALQKREAEARQELQTLSMPIQRAQAYVEEQISAKLGDALKAAMTKAKVDLVVGENATVSYQPTVDITAAVVTELNTLVPNVSITPPANWQPGQQQDGAAAPAAAPATGQAPQSR